MDNLINNKQRLIWSCRRGMLELDVLLRNFLDACYDNLTPMEKQNFVELLDEPDPMLFAWLMGHEVPNQLKFNHITHLIRQHARSRV